MPTWCNANPTPEAGRPTLLVGLGRIGLGYDLTGSAHQVFSHAKACALHPGIALVAGVDPDPAKREAFTRATGRPAFPDLAAVPKPPAGYDLAIVATPPEERQTLVAKLLHLPVRALLLEKPLAPDPTTARNVVNACRNAGVPLYVNYFRNFDPALADLHVWAAAHGFGPCLRIVCHYSGSLANNGSHYLSLLGHWFGPPTAVPSSREGGATHLSYGEVPCALFPFAGDCDFGELDLLFHGGRLRLVDYTERIEAYQAAPDPYFAGYRRLQPMEEQPPQPEAQRYQYLVLDRIVSDLATPGHPLANGEAAVHVLELCQRLQEGRP